MNGYRLSTRLLDNRFGPNRKVASCKINATTGTDVTAARNVMDATGSAVGIVWTDD